MAHLRDVKTSEVVFEGTPLECALMGEELGGAAVVGLGELPPDDVELVYDDVGVGFDPDAVLTAHRENVDGLAGAARAAKGTAKRPLEEAHREAKAAGALRPDRVREATAALEDARSRLED